MASLALCVVYRVCCCLNSVGPPKFCHWVFIGFDFDLVSLGKLLNAPRVKAQVMHRIDIGYGESV